jgi:hypothetical protein
MQGENLFVARALLEMTKSFGKAAGTCRQAGRNGLLKMPNPEASEFASNFLKLKFQRDGFRPLLEYFFRE